MRNFDNEALIAHGGQGLLIIKLELKHEFEI